MGEIDYVVNEGWDIRMGELKNNWAKKISAYIFLPLLINLFYVHQMGINISYIIVLIQSIIFLISIRQIKINIDKTQGIILFLFLILFTIGILSSLFSRLQLESLKRLILVFITSLFLILLIISDDRPDITFNKVIKTQMMIGVVFAIIAIILYFFGSISSMGGITTQALGIGPIKLHQRIMGRPPYYRVTSLTNNPNTLGIILMFSQISTIYLYKVDKLSKKKSIGFYLIQMLALLLTQSRGAILTTIIMLTIFFLLLSEKRNNRIKIYIGFLVLLVLSVIIVFASDSGVFSRFQGGLSNRNLAWNILIDRIVEHLYVGLGFGVSNEAALNNLGIKAHNIFLNSLSEIGVIGFLLFLGIWLFGIISSLIGLKVNKENFKIKTMYVFICSVLISLIFHQMIENKLLVYDYVMFLWVYLISSSILNLDIERDY